MGGTPRCGVQDTATRCPYHRKRDDLGSSR
jgi:hypothetical protein